MGQLIVSQVSLYSRTRKLHSPVFDDSFNGVIAFCTTGVVLALIFVVCLHRGVFRPNDLGISGHLLGLAASSHGVYVLRLPILKRQ